MESLIELYKGNEAFTEKLDTFFQDEYYNHGEKKRDLPPRGVVK